MTTFLIIMEFIILLLILSVIYSQAQTGRETRAKMTQLAQDYLSLEHKIQKLERQTTELKNKEASNGDNSGSVRNGAAQP